MSKTSIHFEACNVSKSELHNSRKQTLDYIFPELSQKNESLYYVKNLAERENECRALYEAKVGQKMQSKTIPIREGVVVIDEKTTMSDLELLANEIRLLLGWTPLQIHIHRDEGYIKSPDNKGGSEVAKLNLHAHIIFDCQNKSTGKMFRNKKYEMSQVQDLCANILQMERGEKSTRQHLKSLEYKIAVKEEHFKELTAQHQQLTEANAVLEKAKKQKEKELSYYTELFSSSDTLEAYEIKTFLGSKIDKEKLQGLIASENVKTALNQKLETKNAQLQKQITQLIHEKKEYLSKISEMEKQIASVEAENVALKTQIETPSETYLKTKLSEYPQREKQLFNSLTEKIKATIWKNPIPYQTLVPLDNLYWQYFSQIEQKNIWDLMHTHYDGGQEQFEKDMQSEVSKAIAYYKKQQEQEVTIEPLQEQIKKRGLKR